MFKNDRIIIDDIIFVNHLVGNAAGSHTEYRTNSINHYQLLYKLKGEAIITFDKKSVTEKEGDIRFLPNPSLFEHPPVYSADVIEKGECINIAFTSETALPKEIIVKNYNCSNALKALFQKMERCWYYKHNGYYSKCMSVLYDIFAIIIESNSQYLSSKAYKQIFPAIDYIDRHFTEQNIECEYLAALCNLSHTYMTKLFKNCFGMSPQKYIISKKVQYACDLLNTKHYSISRIAEKSGFSNTYYFSRVFKNHIGVCPSKYI